MLTKAAAKLDDVTRILSELKADLDAKQLSVPGTHLGMQCWDNMLIGSRKTEIA